MDYYKKDIKEIYKEFSTSKEGLSAKKAQENFEKYGPNELKQKKKISPWKIFFGQFTDPMVVVLIIAAIISVIIGYIEYTHNPGSSLLSHQFEAILIIVIIVVNAIIGFKQEYSAEKAIEALKKLASLKSVVLRDGKKVKIDSKDIVPGDILVLEEGEKIPADSRIISLVNLKCEEAALTGESLPVEKELKIYNKDLGVGDRKNMIFSGTIITQGKGLAVVVKTGMLTEIGKIADMIQSTEDGETPLQKKLAVLGKKLGLITLGICIAVFILGVFKGNIQDIDYVLNVFLRAVSLAVAAIPEGLPIVVTIALSLGVGRMIKRNALIRNLPSVETLGSTTVICSDKTGTLTHNQMTVKKVYVDGKTIDVNGAGYEPEGTFSDETKDMGLLLRIGLLNNDSKLVIEKKKYSVIGDPTEGALVVSAAKKGLDKEEIDKKYPRLDELPFDSTRKMMTTIHNISSKKYGYTKGAPDILLKNCDRIIIDGKVKKLDSKTRKQVMDKNLELSSEALRVLGFAYKELTAKTKKSDYEENMIFVGLQGMIDPPRSEVKDAIAKCKSASIKVIMITGDYIGTAKAIATELGIEGKAILGEELKNIDLAKEVENIGVYARVNPEDKMLIVEALQNKGHVVAMTGDGVNDAPALKKADMGISMGITGTDVAKEASDMILTDDNFASIVNAVEEGRGIFDNIMKFILYLLSSNIGEVFVVFFGMIFNSGFAISAFQLLWINVVTDGLPATALSVDPIDDDVMTRKPRKMKSGVLNRFKMWFMVSIGVIMMIGVLGIYEYSFKASAGNQVYATTMAFTTLMMFQMFNVFNCRSLVKSTFKVGIFSNMHLVKAVIFSITTHVGLLFVTKIFPAFGESIGITILSLMDWLIVSAVASTVVIVWEILKGVGIKGHNA
ncbi:calcium-translocating P-type ATPase, SERCA-type [archaeon]|jgi:P-type Ca2+ transporter type 2C|nr:calcium-translocating P-type ATPase, SERCA-type [archaeon]MBT4352565.1 calcium-translocating P-type ATPase, SERCA-type [archaeon]MBT4648586.1 calcium-translocating P-type ATPase, SERCA-type [archaeon]MBT6821411.1 calcium-translocating P-type ATPase, SERCA-type [archaeon]